MVTSVKPQGGKPRLKGADVKQREQAYEKLAESEERYRNIVELAPDGIITTNLKGVVTSCNTAFSDLTGHSKDKILGKHFSKLPTIRIIDVPTYIKVFASAIRGKVPTCFEFTWVHKDGSVRLGEANIGLLRNHSKIAGIQAIIRDITERRQAEERIEHLNSVLRAIRNVNQLISKEKDHDSLLKGTCYNLIETRGYRNAWIALINESGELVTAAEAGLGKDFLPIVKRLERGELTYCGRRALGQSDVVATENPLSACAGCPLTGKYRGFGAMTVRLEYGEKVYGVLAVCVIKDFVKDDEELALLKEVAGDVAFALHNIELEEGYKLAEEALRESEEKYREVVERAHEAIAIVQESVIKYINARVSEIMGYAPEDVIGTPIADYIYPNELPKVLDRYQRRLAGEDVEPVYETAVLHKDGSRVDVELNAGLINYQGKPADLAMIRDITERKQAEEALRESEEKYRTILEDIEDGYYEVDIAGNFTFFNDSMCEILGYSQDEMIGMNNRQYMDEDNTKKVFQAFNRVYTTGKHTREFGWEIIRKDGTKRFIETSVSLIRNSEGEPTGFRGIARDITERRQAEEALRKSEERYRLLAENATDVITSLDTNLQTTYTSPSVERLLGFTVEEAVSRTMEESLTPASCRIAAEMLAKELAIERKGQKHPSRSLRQELEFYRKDGSTVWVEVIISLLRDSEGHLSGMVNVLRDITERRQAEQALRQREQQFRALIENSMDAIAIINSDGTIRYESPSAKRVLGYKSEEMIGQDILEFIHPDDVQRVVNTFTMAIENPGHTVSMELRFLHKDGSWLILEGVGKSLLDDPRINGIVANYRDITERKRAEEELRESEEKYRTILENIEDGYYEVDIAGNLTFFNDPMCKINGYSKDEMIGMNNRQYMDEANAKKVYQAFNRVYTTGEHTREFDWEIIRKDGTKRFVEGSISLKRNSEGEPIGFRGIARDITERRQAEEALRESEEKFRQLVEDMNDGYGVVQGSTIVFGNSRIAEKFGYTQEEVIGKSIDKFIPPRIVDELTKVHKRRKRGEAVPSQYETVLLKKDGTECPVELGAKVIEYAGKPAMSVIIRDITERKQAEEVLRESEGRYRLLAENVRDVIWTMDMNLQLTYFSPSVTRLRGYSVEEAMALSLEETLTPASYEVALKTFAEEKAKIEAGQRDLLTPVTLELEHRCKDGSTVWTEAMINGLPDSDGRLVGILGITRDITERKQVEEEKQRIEGQLQITGRLAAVGELVAGVAHELNNPLAAIQAYAELLQERDDLDETAKADVVTIHSQAQRASKVTGNLLAFARQTKPEKRPVSINEVVEKSLELHAYRMRVNNIEVTTELEPDLPKVMADFNQMQQIFMNLVTNAEQSMTEAHGRGKLVVKTRKLGDIIQAEVTDDGPGIPEENLKRLFDPFFTTKEVGKGTGLGLSICYGIVQEHGGSLYAKSKPGKGASFVVEIPLISKD